MDGRSRRYLEMTMLTALGLLILRVVIGLYAVRGVAYRADQTG